MLRSFKLLLLRKHHLLARWCAVASLVTTLGAISIFGKFQHGIHWYAPSQIYLYWAAWVIAIAALALPLTGYAMRRRNAIGALGLASFSIVALLVSSQGPEYAAYDMNSHHTLQMSVDSNNPQILNISGMLHVDLAQQLRDYLKSLDPARREQLHGARLTSPGGNVQAMFLANGVLNDYGITTRIAQGHCDSACAMLWTLGGVRLKEVGSTIGYHSPSTYSNDANDVTRDWFHKVLRCVGASEEFSYVATTWPQNGDMFRPNDFWLMKEGLLSGLYGNGPVPHGSPSHCNLPMPDLDDS